MAKVFIEESTLTAIGDAIRGKEGTTALVPVNDMATRITDLPSGGGGNEPTDEELTVTGNCSRRFSQGGWDWFIRKYGDRITTKDITNAGSMFSYSQNLEEIPFEINFKQGGCDTSSMFQYCKLLNHIPDLDLKQTSYYSMKNMFDQCTFLKEIPAVYNAYPGEFGYFFQSCYRLRNIPEDFFDTWNFSRVNSYNYASLASLFKNCYSLRKIPEKLFTNLKPVATSTSYALYGNLVDSCYALDEITNLTVSPATFTSNVFSDTASKCYRLKNFTFETNEDGTPKTANWKSQTIDLTTVGSERLSGTQINYILTKPAEYAQGYSMVCQYNSGISPDKVIVDDVTYQALKNDPDSFVCSDNDTANGASPYSRYNLESATRTINSLPDTSAYGRNTIKFKTGAGTATDGGGITAETMTELSALADSKGWTVALS